jgi:DNA-binding response OmpR family regulator
MEKKMETPQTRPLVLTFQVPAEATERVGRSLGARRRICPWTPDADWNLLDREDVAALVLSDAGATASACAWIRRLRHRIPGLPIIFLARRHSAEIETEVRRAGIHYYLHDTALETELPLVLEALEHKQRPAGAERREHAGSAAR